MHTSGSAKRRLASALGAGILAGLLLSLTPAVPAAQQTATGVFLRLLLGGSVDVATGTGTPESSVTGTVGDLFVRTDGGASTVFYVKESGASTTTGWVAVQTAPVYWWPAAICQNATPLTDWSTPTSNPGVAACQTGTNTQYGTLDFADGANALSVQRTLRLPANWVGAIDARLVWFTSATSGNVVWQVATICVADAETSDPAFNTASTVTDAAKGTTLQLNDATISTVTVTGCAAGEVMFLKLTRDPAHASDTLAATARLVGLELTLKKSS